MSPVTNQWNLIKSPHALLMISVENGQTQLSDPHASTNSRLPCVSALVQESLPHTPHPRTWHTTSSLTNFLGTKKRVFVQRVGLKVNNSAFVSGTLENVWLTAFVYSKNTIT